LEFIEQEIQLILNDGLKQSVTKVSESVGKDEWRKGLHWTLYDSESCV